MVPLAFRMALPALLLAACAAVFQEEGAYEESFAIDGLSKIEIRGLDGDLELRAAGGSAFVARGTAFATGATRAAARDNLAEARLTGRVDGSALLAVFDPPLGLAGLVELELDRASDLPEEIDVTARVGWGDIAARGLQGALELATADGDIAVANAGSRAVSLRAERGGIAVEARGQIDAWAGKSLVLRSRGQDGQPLRGATRGGRISLALEQRDFHIRCWPEGGAVRLGPGLDAAAHEEPDGSVLVLGGDQGLAREVLLLSAGGDIEIDFLSE